MRPTIKITLTAILAAIGIVLRSMGFTIITNVQLTPGMIAPILSGMLLGIWPGIATGAIIGIYAALVSGEFWVIPLLGNICLGLSTGVITTYLKNVDAKIISVLYLISAAVIGGFLPTFVTILAFLPETMFVAAISGMFDFINALIAAVIALVIWGVVMNQFKEFKNEK